MTTPSPPTARVGARFGRFRLVRPLGEGAFGATWLAEDAGLEVVLKMLSGPPGDELARLASVRHPGVVRLLGAGTAPSPWLAMTRAPGDPLNALAGLGVADALLVLASGADALAAVHAAGFAHGDVQPANLVRDPATGLVTWIDFGLAGLDGSGGNARYAAPERAAGAGTGPAADVYALCRLVQELLSDGDPAPGDDDVPNAPNWARRALLAGLAADPASRPSAAWLADTCVANGVPLPPPDVERVLDRLQVGHVETAADARIAAWLDHGGVVRIVGPPDSGRTHLLERAALGLHVRGACFARIRDGDIASALLDADLPGPTAAAPDDAPPGDRALLLAERVAARFDGPPVLLVDDVDAHAGATEVLRALARFGASLLVVGGDLDGDVVETGAFDAAAADALVVAALGDASARPALAPELPVRVGALARTVRIAARRGAVRWLDRRFVVDAERVSELRREGAFDPEAGLPDAAARLVVAVVLAGPIAVARALDLADVGPDALAAALDHGAVARDGDRLRAVSGASHRTHPAAREVAARLLATEADAPVARRAAWAIAAADSRAAVALDPATITGEPGEISRLLDELYALAPTDRLAAARIEARIAAGRLDEAVAAAVTGGPPEAVVASARARVLQARRDGGPAAARSVYDALSRTVPESPSWRDLGVEVAFHAGDDVVVEVRATDLAADPDAARRLRAVGFLAQSRLRAGDRAGAIATLDAVPAELGAGTAARGAFDGVRGRVLWHLGRLADASAAFERAAEAPLSVLDRARLKNNAALARYLSGDLPHALDGWEEARVGFERLGDRAEQARVWTNLCQGLREAGRVERANEAGRRAVALAEAVGDVATLRTAWGNLGDVAAAGQDWTGAEAAWGRCEALSDPADASGAVELARRRAEVALRRRDPAAVDRARAALAAAEAADERVEAGRIRALVACAAARTGDAATARAEAAAGVEALVAAGAAGELAWARLWVAHAEEAQGRFEDARRTLERVAAWADEVGHGQLRGEADRLRASLAEQGALTGGDGRLSLLARLAVGLARTRDADALVGQVAAAALRLLDADRAFVLEVLDGEPVVVARAYGLGRSGEPSASVARRALELGRDVVATDVGERGDLRGAKSVVALDLSAVFCAPLRDGDALVGLLYVDGKAPPGLSLTDAQELLRALAGHAATAIGTTRLLRERDQRLKEAIRVAHDLRSPLAGVTLILHELIDGDAVDGPLRDELPVALRALERVGALAERVLGAAPEASQAIDLDAAVAEATAETAAAARAAEVTVALRGRSGAVVRAPRRELARALDNLLSNAVRHSPRGGRVDVVVASEGASAVVTVRDRGCGLGGRPLDALIGRAPTGGHGHGLAICRDIVVGVGGTLDGEDAPGGGASLRIRLPAR